MIFNINCLLSRPVTLNVLFSLKKKKKINKTWSAANFTWCFKSKDFSIRLFFKWDIIFITRVFNGLTQVNNFLADLFHL